MPGMLARPKSNLINGQDNGKRGPTWSKGMGRKQRQSLSDFPIFPHFHRHPRDNPNGVCNANLTKAQPATKAKEEIVVVIVFVAAVEPNQTQPKPIQPSTRSLTKAKDMSLLVRPTTDNEVLAKIYTNICLCIPSHVLHAKTPKVRSADADCITRTLPRTPESWVSKSYSTVGWEIWRM